MITSTNNPAVKQWKKLHQKKYREQTGTFLVEGFHLVEEAVKSDWHIDMLIVENDKAIPSSWSLYPSTVVTANVFRVISQTKTPQGMAAVVTMRENETITGDLMLLIDAVQDPGNLGTLIRTADAAGMSGVVIGNGTVDMYHEKVIRATQGSLFHIPVFQEDLVQTMQRLHDAGYTIWASSPENASLYTQARKQKKMALIVGNEGSGIRADIIGLAHESVKIPLYGNAESLNVSIAAGILMYAMQTDSPP